MAREREKTAVQELASVVAKVSFDSGGCFVSAASGRIYSGRELDLLTVTNVLRSEVTSSTTIESLGFLVLFISDLNQE